MNIKRLNLKKVSPLFVIAMLSIAMIISGCSSLTKIFLKDPELNVVSVKAANISLTDISIDIEVNVKNPNQIEINLDSLAYKLSLSGETVAEGNFDNEIIIPASDQKKIIIPVKFRFNSIQSILTGMMEKSFKNEYEFSGNAIMGGVLKGVRIPFLQKGELNLGKNLKK